MREEDKEKIAEVVEKIVDMRDTVLKDFLNILFWKNGHEGYLAPDDKYNVISLLDTSYINGPEGETWIDWDKEKGLELANIIRSKICLPKLICEYGNLKEVKEEVR